MRKLFDVLNIKREMDALMAQDKCNRNGQSHWNTEAPWKGSDLKWVTPKDESGMRHFQESFNLLRLAEQLSFIGDVTMLTGLYLIRQNTQEKHWHHDFFKTHRKAFTFITPLQETTDVNLLYKKTLHGPEYTYKYAYGEGIFFGDGFLHCTEPGRSRKPLSFLCFTFGCKDMGEEAWCSTELAISGQCRIYNDLQGNLISWNLKKTSNFKVHV